MTQQPPDAVPLRQVVDRIIGHLRSAASPGDLAALRRTTPDSPLNGTTFRILATFVDEARPLPLHDPERGAAERRWATLLQAAAIAVDKVDAESHIGVALANAGFSELRLERLLRADPDELADHVRGAISYLTSKDERFSVREIASLLLDPPAAAEATRRRVARDYYRTLHHLKKDS